MESGTQVALVENLEALLPLAPAWLDIHQHDSHAHIFASWPWFRGLLDNPPESWAVLVVSIDGEPAAFWPVQTRTVSRFAIPLLRELRDGTGGLADYTGLTCREKQVEAVIATLATYLQNWDRIILRDVKDSRLMRLVSLVSRQGFSCLAPNALSCRSLELPDNWDSYLHQNLGGSARRNLRRSLRELEQAGDIEVSDVQGHDLPQYLDALLELWQKRFTRVSPLRLIRLKATFTSCFNEGMASLIVLKRGRDILAGVARFHDRKRKRAYELINSFDQNLQEIHSPGMVVIALGLQQAIGQGIHRYDFLRGDEEYKAHLGASLEHCFSFDLVKSNLYTAPIRAKNVLARYRQKSREAPPI